MTCTAASAPRSATTSGAGAQVVDELLGRLGRLVVEELPVDHHDRREVAGRVALEVLQRDLAVGGRLVVADAEVLVELSQIWSPPMTAHSVLVQTPTW